MLRYYAMQGVGLKKTWETVNGFFPGKRKENNCHKIIFLLRRLL